jgi:hypothetical protein
VSSRVAAVALIALAAAMLPSPVESQQTQDIEGMNATVEGTLTSVTLSLLPQLMAVSGEAYEALDGWLRQTLALIVGFKGGYAVGARGAVASLREQDFDEDARATDFTVELLWDRPVGSFRLTAGPVVGYGRVARPAYGETTHGFLAGGRADLSRAVIGNVVIELDVSAVWSSFNTLSFAAPAPPGFEQDAIGRRLMVGLGVGYAWPFGSGS